LIGGRPPRAGRRVGLDTVEVFDPDINVETGGIDADGTLV
jgi:hypothetical protein